MSFSTVSLSSSNPDNSFLTIVFSYFNFYDVDILKNVNHYWLSQCNTCFKNMLTTPIKRLHPPKQTLFGDLFVTSNETGIEQTFEKLAKMQKIRDGVHLGVSALHNWDFAVAMRSRYVILLDHAPLVTVFNKQAIDILRTSDSRHKCKEALAEVLTAKVYVGRFFNILYAPKGSSKEQALFEIDMWMQKTHSALHTDEGFSYMQKLARENKIITITCSLQNTETVGEIARIVKRAGLPFSSLYLSNVYDHFACTDMHEADLEAQKNFKGSVSHLKEDLTCIIDATSYLSMKGICQQTAYGKEYVPAIEKITTL